MVTHQRFKMWAKTFCFVVLFTVSTFSAPTSQTTEGKT
jgi:hypothetical protein